MKKYTYTLLISFFSFTLSAQNESEPNNSFSQANLIAFGNTISGYINPGLDKDYFKFNVTIPGMIKLQILNVPSNIDLDAHIYDFEQVEIRKKTNSNSGQGYILWVSTCQIGNHYLRLRDGGNGSTGGSSSNNSEQFSFKLEFTPFASLDDCECNNNSFSQACEINAGETIGALIAPWFDDDELIKDKDYYKFNVSEPSIIKLQVLTVPENIDLDVFFYKPSPLQEQIWKDYTHEEGQGYIVELGTCDIGDHYLYFRDGGNPTNGGISFNSEQQYTFRVDIIPFSSIDNCECNNEINSACTISMGNTIEALINPWLGSNNGNSPSSGAEDIDFYKFNIPEAGMIKLEVLNVPGNINLQARIFNSSQTLIRSSYNVGNGIPYTLWVSSMDIGYHYLLLRDKGSGNNAGSAFDAEEQYRFKIDFIPFIEVDECEVNNDFNTACEINLCEPIEAVIAPWFGDSDGDKDLDYYKIDLVANIQISISLNPVPASGFYSGGIYNSDFEWVDIFLSTGLGVPIEAFYTPTESGTYYLKIVGEINTEEQYTLNVGCNLVDSTNGLDNKSNEVDISPNPFTNHVIIQSQFPIQSIQVFDAIGNQIPFKKEGNLNKIETTNWQSGIYFILIQTEAGLVSKKLVKQ